jgi:telomerase reverse transcriptase
MAYVLMKSKGKNKRNKGYVCGVKKRDVECIALVAFREVLGRRQSGYRGVIEWCKERIGSAG